MGMVLETGNRRRNIQESIAAKVAEARQGAESGTAYTDSQMDRLLLWAQKFYGTDEFIAAKEDFFDFAGKVFADEGLYEQRMSYFLDFFLLQRPVRSQNVQEATIPLHAYLKTEAKTSSASSDFFAPDQRHSLFEIKKNSLTEGLVVRDLFSNDTLRVGARPHESFGFIQRGEMFQGFLYAIGTRHFLSPGVVFHPAKVSRILKRIIKEHRKNGGVDQLSVLGKLARVQLNYWRYGQNSPEKLYKQLL